MSRLVKIVDNKYVQIEEYKNPNICFNTNEYDDFENYCTLRETFDPFEMFYENQGLKKQLEEKNKPQIFIDTQDIEERYAEGLYQDYLEEENKKYKEVIDKSINNSQYWIDYYTRLNSDERIALRLQENIDILKEVE